MLRKRQFSPVHIIMKLREAEVLFLDEMVEFPTRVLGEMRQPLEDNMMTISREQGSLTFPANFQLVGAIDP